MARFLAGSTQARTPIAGDLAGSYRLGALPNADAADPRAPKGTSAQTRYDATPRFRSAAADDAEDEVWSDGSSTLVAGASDTQIPSSLLPVTRRLSSGSALHNSSAHVDPTAGLLHLRNINKRHGHSHRNGFVNYGTLVNRAGQEIAADGAEEAGHQPPLAIDHRAAGLHAAEERCLASDFTEDINDADNDDLSEDGDGSPSSGQIEATYWAGCRPLRDEHYDVSDASESARREAHRAATLQLLEGLPCDMRPATISSRMDNERIGKGANKHHRSGGSQLRSLFARLRRFVARHAQLKHVQRRG